MSGVVDEVLTEPFRVTVYLAVDLVAVVWVVVGGIVVLRHCDDDFASCGVNGGEGSSFGFFPLMFVVNGV
jgi:hypothetical protein